MTAATQPIDQIADEAARWCVELFGNDAESADIAAFEAWVAIDPAHGLAFEKAASTWRGLDSLEDNEQFLQMRHEALSGSASNSSRWRGWFGNRPGVVAAVAASITAILLIAGWYAEHMPSYYTTPVAGRETVQLADGSTVSLDSDTGISFRQAGESRMASLEKGRAMFKVASDPLSPFSVRAGNKIVVATGTKFSIEMLKGQLRVALYEGKVAVIEQNVALRAQNPSGKILSPGDHLIVEKTGSAHIEKMGSDQSAQWLAGTLSFTDEPLSVAVEEMNRYSPIKIILQPSIQSSKVSGIFKAGESENFVAGVKALLKLQSRRDGDVILIFQGDADI